MTTNAIAQGGSLREQRLAAGLTQEQLARAADCSLAYVRLLERGYRPERPDTPKVRSVRAALADSPLNDAGPAENRAARHDIAGEAASDDRRS